MSEEIITRPLTRADERRLTAQKQRAQATGEPIDVISLGAGVQSSTMGLMAGEGLITPMPVAAVFADTQAEPKSVYKWLDWLEKKLPFPVIRVTQGNLEESR